MQLSTKNIKIFPKYVYIYYIFSIKNATVNKKNKNLSKIFNKIPLFVVYFSNLRIYGAIYRGVPTAD